MYLLFADESGTPPKPDKAAGKYMVLGGLIVPEGVWRAIAKEFGRVREEYAISGEIKWKFFGPDNNDPKNSIDHLTKERKQELRDDLFRIVTSRKSVKVICCVTSIEAAYARPTIITQEDVYHLTYKGLTERFQYFLQDATRITGQTQSGIVVCDHRMTTDDKKLRARHHQLIETDEEYTSTYANFIETIFFSPSEASVGLQLADMVAGAVHRSFQYGEHRFANQIQSAFRASPTGKILGYGLVKMPLADFISPAKGSFL